MKFKIMLLFLIFNFGSAICNDRLEKEAAAAVVSCGHATLNPFCVECGIAASQSASASETSFAPNACVHTSDKNYCLLCNPINSSNSSSKVSDSDKSITIEPKQCQEHIYNELGYCTKCQHDMIGAAGIGGSRNANITSGPNYKKYVFGASVIALAIYLWKKFR